MPTTSQFIAGTYIKQAGYRAFMPKPVAQEWLIDKPEINELLEKANLSLGQLEAYSQIVPSINVYLRIHIAKEATVSSRIEGTQTELDEAFMDEEELAPDRRDDWREVQNYIRAMDYGLQQVHHVPLTHRLITLLHSMILQGVRGEHRAPGRYRSSQNWIGGASINDATFVPPPHTEVPHLMKDLEVLLNPLGKLQMPHLLRIGLVHYQFETIHPFLDGNGRLGRLLITLYLIAQKVLSRPTLYLSDILYKNRQTYYDRLMHVRDKNDLHAWLSFFLVTVHQAAQKSIEIFKALQELNEHLSQTLVPSMGRRAANTQTLINSLYKQPVVSTKHVQEVLNTSQPSASKLINTLVEKGLLHEITGMQRNRLFSFEPYLKLFRS